MRMEMKVAARWAIARPAPDVSACFETCPFLVVPVCTVGSESQRAHHTLHMLRVKSICASAAILRSNCRASISVHCRCSPTTRRRREYRSQHPGRGVLCKDSMSCPATRLSDDVVRRRLIREIDDAFVRFVGETRRPPTFEAPYCILRQLDSRIYSWSSSLSPERDLNQPDTIATHHPRDACAVLFTSHCARSAVLEKVGPSAMRLPFKTNVLRRRASARAAAVHRVDLNRSNRDLLMAGDGISRSSRLEQFEIDTVKQQRHGALRLARRRKTFV